jgi:hypothetical protein
VKLFGGFPRLSWVRKGSALKRKEKKAQKWHVYQIIIGKAFEV